MCHNANMSLLNWINCNDFCGVQTFHLFDVPLLLPLICFTPWNSYNHPGDAVFQRLPIHRRLVVVETMGVAIFHQALKEQESIVVECVLPAWKP